MTEYRCPLCEGCGVVSKMPVKLKREKCHKMRELGFSVREIMRALNYKSPRSVQEILEKAP